MKIKSMSMLISFVLICASICLPDIRAEKSAKEPYYRQELLQALGMQVKSNETPYTRKEAAKALVCLNKITIAEAETVFSDVKPDDEFTPYIAAAYTAGIISGYGAAEFRPDAAVTYMEFFKMALDSLGYKKYAEHLGGYPAGYMDLIISTRISKDIEFSDYSRPVTGNDAAVILFNTLHTEVMAISEISQGAGSFKVIKGKNLLSERYDILQVTGIMTANSISTLFEHSEKNGRISIDAEDYTAKAKFNKYLGYRVNAYIRGGEEAVYVYPAAGNSVSVVKGDDVLKSSTKQSLKYSDENDKTYTVKISENASYFYNGAYVGNMATEIIAMKDLMLENAEYTLLDNDNDGVCDFVFANKYVYFKILSANRDEHFIYDDFSGLKINLTEKDSIMFADGTETDFSVLKYNDILAGKIPQNTDLENRSGSLEFILLDKTVYGKVTGAGDEYVTIEDAQYKINTEYGADKDEIYGKTGTFFLDANDKIIAYSDSTQAADEVYAYIIEIGNDGIGTAGTAVKILAQNGEVNIENIAENVSVFKEKTLYLSGVSGLLSKKDEIENKLVKIVISNSEIKKIILPEILSYGAGGSKDACNMLEKRSYTTRSGVLDDLYLLPSDIMVFCIPNDTSDDANYGVTNRKGVTFTETNFECEIYGIDENYTAAAMLIRKNSLGTQAIKADGNIFVIDKIYAALNSENEETVKMRGMEAGEFKEYIFQNAETKSMTWDENYPNEAARKRSMFPSELDRGDIILLTEEEGEIVSFRVLLDYSEDADFAFSSADEYQDGIGWGASYPFVAKASIYAWGQINCKGDEYVGITVSGADKNIFFSRLKNIYLADMQEGRIKKIHYMDGELLSGRRAFMFFSWGTERDLVIYK